jgi:uncharacterized membrane protein YfhO
MAVNRNKAYNRYIVLFLLGVLTLFYFPAIFGGKVIAPHIMSQLHPWNGLSGHDNYGYYVLNDVLDWYYPNHCFIKENFSLNNIWAWDPYRYSGQPFTYLGPAVYFSTWLFLPSVLTGMTAAAIFLMLVSGISMFYFLKELDIDDGPSLLGAAAYMLNSYSLIYSGFFHELAASSLLPAVFLFAEKAIKQQRRIYIAPLAMVFTFLAYNGKPQLTVHLIYLMFFYMMFRLLQFHGRDRKDAVEGALIIFGVSGLLAALMYLPQGAALYELARHSDRLSKTFDFFAQSKFPLKYLVTLVSFNLFGRPMGPDFWGAGFMHGFVDSYTGIIPVMMLLAATCTGKWRRAYFWLGALTVAFLLVLNNGFYRLFVDYVPGFRISRNRPTEIVIFCVIVLASIGFDNLLRYKDRAKLRYIFLSILVLACAMLAASGIVYFTPAMDAALQYLRGMTRPQLAGALRSAMYTLTLAALCSAAVLMYLKGKLKARAFQGAVITLVLIDVFLVNRQLRYVQAPSDLYRMTPGIELLKNDKSVFRVMRFGDEAIMPPDTLEVYGIQDAQVYDSILNRDYVAYMKNIESDISSLDNRIIGSLKRVGSLDLPALKLLNVKYLLSVKDISGAGWKLVYDREMKIYQNMDLLPRAFVTHGARVIKDRAEILARLKDRGFRPASEVILEEAPPDGFTPGETGPGDRATIARYSSKFVDVDVKAGADGFLVLTDTYWPDWRAYVDGGEARIYKADYLFRAVPVKKGSHKVRFVFEPRWLNKYYYIALASLAALLSLLAAYTIKWFTGRLKKSTSGRIVRSWKRAQG